MKSCIITGYLDYIDSLKCNIHKMQDEIFMMSFILLHHFMDKNSILDLTKFYMKWMQCKRMVQNVEKVVAWYVLKKNVMMLVSDCRCCHYNYTITSPEKDERFVYLSDLILGWWTLELDLTVIMSSKSLLVTQHLVKHIPTNWPQTIFPPCPLL